MGMISILSNSYSMQGYIAFDPARQALREDPNSMDPVIVEAIRNQHFIGIKLYPPMGFRPIGNAELEDSPFPSIIARKLAPNVGRKIDDALLVLYKWCLEHQVPDIGTLRRFQLRTPRICRTGGPAILARGFEIEDAIRARAKNSELRWNWSGAHGKDISRRLGCAASVCGSRNAVPIESR